MINIEITQRVPFYKKKGPELSFGSLTKCEARERCFERPWCEMSSERNGCSQFQQNKNRFGGNLIAHRRHAITNNCARARQHIGPNRVVSSYAQLHKHMYMCECVCVCVPTRRVHLITKVQHYVATNGECSCAQARPLLGTRSIRMLCA